LLYARVLDAVVARMDRVYVLRPEVGNLLDRRVRGLDERVRPFRVPVDVSRFPLSDGRDRRDARAELCRQLAIPDEARIVVFAGRLEAVKHPEAIIRVARAMAAEPRPVHFVIAGTGSLRQEMERTAGAVAPGRMHFLGPVPQDRLASVFGAADGCLLPSGFEALPNVVLESLACGTPVVASSSSGGVAGLMAGRDIGRLASNDPEAFAAGLRVVFAWEGSRAEACHQAALAFAPEALNAPIYEDVRSLVGSGRALAPAGTT
jgi:glycosyltransferase involved in cell wall biosynthesis